MFVYTVVLVITFCIVEPFNFTSYTKRTYMCDTCGLITANRTCPFGTSWSQLYNHVPTVDHVSSNGGHCTDGWMDAANCSSRPCSPDVYTVRARVRMRTRYPNVPIDRSMCALHQQWQFTALLNSLLLYKPIGLTRSVVAQS